MSDLWSKTTMAPYRERGDEVADVLARRLYDERGERALNDAWKRSLQGPAGAKATPEWNALSAEFEVPLTADERRRLINAQRFFGTWGPLLAAAYLMRALPNTYAVSRGVKALWITARLQTDPMRRVIETCKLPLDVLRPQPEGLDAKSLETVKRIRLMHAYIRVLIKEKTWLAQKAALPELPGVKRRRWMASARRRVEIGMIKMRTSSPMGCQVPKEWEFGKWGEPLNQDDMVATVMAFGYLPILALDAEGIAYEPGDADDFVFAWSVIGRFLGVDRSLWPVMPTTKAEAAACWNSYAEREQWENCEGRELTKSLIKGAERTIPGRLFDPLMNEFFYLQLCQKREGSSKDSVAKMLGLRRSRFWKYLYWLVRRTLRLTRLQERILGRDEALGYDIFHWVVTNDSAYTAEPFVLSEELRTLWGLPDTSDRIWKQRKRFGIRNRSLSSVRGLAGAAERQEAVARRWQEPDLAGERAREA